MSVFQRSTMSVLLIFLLIFLCLSVVVFSRTNVVVHASASYTAERHSGSSVSQMNWPMYGLNSHHTNFNPSETILNSTTVSHLKLAWKAQVNGYGRGSQP